MTKLCDRSSNDDLLSLFMNDYKINLLELPRKTLDVATLFIQKANPPLVTCRLEDIFKKTPGNFLNAANEPLPKIDKTYSGKLDTKVGLSFVDRLYKVMGGSVSGKLSTAYKGATSTQISVSGATEDTADIGKLAKYVADAPLRLEQTLFVEGDRLFVATGVIRATGIEVVAHGSADGAIKVDAKAAGLAEANTSISAKSSGVSKMKYSGKIPLAIGVRLLEIVWPDGGPARLDTVRDVLKVAGHAVSHEDYKLLGDDAFIEVSP